MPQSLSHPGTIHRWLIQAAEPSPLVPPSDAQSSADVDWCASELVLTEAVMAVERLGLDGVRHRRLLDAMYVDWDRFHVVPVDGRCLDTAARLGRRHPLRISDAVHLAAADRLPRPVTYLTHEPAQIPVALALNYAVVGVRSG